MNINLNYYALEKEIRSFAGRFDVGLQLHRYGTEEEANRFVPHATLDPKTGQRVVHLLQPEPHWCKEKLIEWRCGFHHELGHFDPEVMDDFRIQGEKKFSMDTLFGLGYNCMSDYRQEKNKLGVYAGRDDVLSKGHHLGVKAIIDNVGDKLAEIPPESDAGIMTGMLGFSVSARENWQRDLSGISYTLRSKMHPTTAEQVQYALDNGYVEKLDACDCAEDLYALWKDMLDNVFNVDANEKEKQSNEKYEQEQAASEGDGEGDGDGSGKGSVKGSGKEEGNEGSEGDGSYGDGDKLRDNEATVDYRQLQVNHHDLESATYAPLRIRYADSDLVGRGNSWKVTPYKDLDIRNYEKGTGSVYDYPNSEYMRSTSKHSVHSGLSNKVRKLLQVKTQTLRVNGQKKGKLTPKSMYRAAMGNAAGGYAEKVFSKKIQQYDLDVSVSVLCDFSGSMGGPKMTHAIVSALMLNEAISKIGVPVEVLGFTHKSAGSVLNIFKTFNKSVSTEKLRECMCAATQCMSNNADGEAILYAYNRLIQQPTKRKLLIVISDGQPAARGAVNGHGDIVGFTKKVIKDIEKDKHVEIYGIGLEDNTVKHFYKHYQVIQHSNELEGAILNVVKNNIIK